MFLLLPEPTEWIKIPGWAFISVCNASQAALNILLLGINAACHLLHEYFAVADRKWHLWVYHENEFHHPLKWCTGKHSIHFKSRSFGSSSALLDGSINTATISQTICWEVRTTEKCHRPVIKGVVAWRESRGIKVIGELSSLRSGISAAGKALPYSISRRHQPATTASPGPDLQNIYRKFKVKKRSVSGKSVNLGL